MKYADLDPVIYPWSEKFGLHIYTFTRDYEIRSMDIVDDSGDIYQLSVSPFGVENQPITVNLWGGKNESAFYYTSLPHLRACLDEAYAQVLVWIKARGHSRAVY